MAVCAAATLAVELGAYFLARAGGSPQREALVTALAACVGWTALASGPMAAGSPVGGMGNWSALLRGAVPADASLVTLAVLWLVVPGEALAAPLALAGILKAYAVLAAMGLFSMAAVCCGRGRAARQTLAVISAFLLALTVAGPFWMGGILHALEYPGPTKLVAWAVRANPFYAVTGALSESLRFFWHEWGLMYEEVATFRDYAPPPLAWHWSPAIHAALAAALGIIAVLRSRTASGVRPGGAGPCRDG